MIFTTDLLLHFLFLHQTATPVQNSGFERELLHFLFLHQTATIDIKSYFFSSCYISCFYIKPQQQCRRVRYRCVATFLVSTSNRNIEVGAQAGADVATFLVSTSNRNYLCIVIKKVLVATFLVSTSNRNHFATMERLWLLLHFLFLHQTATVFPFLMLILGCYISCFYIKPQL